MVVLIIASANMKFVSFTILNDEQYRQILKTADVGDGKMNERKKFYHHLEAT